VQACFVQADSALAGSGAPAAADFPVAQAGPAEQESAAQSQADSELWA